MWKKILFFSLLVSSLSFSQTILDYYNEYFKLIKAGKIKDDLKFYKISRKNNKYYTISCNGEEMDVVVDIKNGYLDVVDEGTGGGTYEIYMALFKSSDKKDYVLIYQSSMDGIGIDQSNLYCYKVENQEWKDVKKEIFAENFWKGFFKEDFYNKNKTKIDNFFKNNQRALLYSLPRYGTDLSLELNYTMGYYLQENEANFFAKMKENLNTEKLILKWDREKAQFLPK
ncbi:MAG: hypothetical protein WHS77_05415 [Brevinematales bacterium]